MGEDYFTTEEASSLNQVTELAWSRVIRTKAAPRRRPPGRSRLLLYPNPPAGQTNRRPGGPRCCPRRLPRRSSLQRGLALGGGTARLAKRPRRGGRRPRKPPTKRCRPQNPPPPRPSPTHPPSPLPTPK